MEEAQRAQQLLEALVHPQPRMALQAVMRGWLESGGEGAEIRAGIQAVIQARQAAGQPADLLEELLDGLSGWCAV